MNTYGWMLLGQALLALLALGLCGGWVLRPFRRADRPYLWLAAPLAGLFALGGVLVVLYFGARLPFRWCLWMSFCVNALATIVCLVRGQLQLPSIWQRTVATVVVLGAAYWGTVSCNKMSIDHREPTLTAMDGSDMFGYAIVADWLRNHSWSDPPRSNQVFELVPYLNLTLDGGRPLAFVLAASAGEVRGTSSLFSYDWAAGVILSAALLGFGGVFASNSLTLVLLVAGAGTSNWLANARSGYFAKSITYPGAILVAGLFLTTVKQFTWPRFATLAALGFAVAFSIAPVFLAVALGVVACCFIGSLALIYPFNRWRDSSISFRAEVFRPGVLALLVFIATVGPAFALHYSSKERIGVPRVPMQWSVVIPVSLDLEPPALPLLKPETERKLLDACFALLVVLAGIALWHRQPTALALIGCVSVIPGSWLLGVPLLHTFQGMLYPLTLAGAALLVAPLAQARWGYVRVGLLVVLIASTVALRVPQIRATADRYLYSAQPHRAVLRASETQALRAAVGTNGVDVPLGHYADSHLVLAELVAQNIPVHLREPAWDRSLKNYTRVTKCPPPDLLAPKARFALLERNAYSPPGSERWVGSRLKLVEDRDTVTVLGISGTQEMIWDTNGRPGVWIGNTPTTFLIHNGTGQMQFIRLLADTSAGPAHPDRTRRTLVYRLGDQSGKLWVPNENQAAIPLRLAVGLNKVELFIEESADPAPKPKHPVPLLAFCNWRIESAAGQLKRT
ncbi:MAG: hypothetical protein L0241_13600 [Planctomycetia bacterium]|nr:hypothetical protein [Planctomycetia bacterium]